ncbi:MAG: ABC transporter permease subunit [Deltaproteobacteria bacterium]|jgi:ABC-type dipeptide/oligopeptide/nickel transport system permease component|nr:ABC transporter permease subunit [Deltaproteobacteria bacterium]MBW2535099.1 ABC transporter permease subunit [Deltaproteobacteria bacterium]
MIRHSFRRLLWVVPSALGVTIVTFFLLSFVPAALPTEGARYSESQLEDLRRQRFLDLPLFVNPRPLDARVRTQRAIDVIVASHPASSDAARARRELLRLGGVSLPFVLPTLDTLDPDARSRVGLALAPLARRMGISDSGEFTDPARVVLSWTRFWETHSVEFRLPTARSAVRRYARYGSEARADELRVLDTFVLLPLMEVLVEPTNRSEVGRARRLIDLAAHVTGRADRVAVGASVSEAAEIVARWQRWWSVYGADYVTRLGAARFAGIVLETRFGKWAGEAVFQGFGEDELGRPLSEQLLARGRVSIAVLLLALALAYGLAIPLGALSALQRSSPVDRAIGVGVLVPYALSPAVLGVLAVSVGWMSPAAVSASPAALVGAAAILALALLADPTRHQRAALLPVLSRDHIVAAVARGAGPWRVVLLHGLRNAMLPVLTRSTLELPAALTSVFVLERAFGLPGLGEPTLTAVASGDTRWLMALTVVAAGWAVVVLVLGDVGSALLDPRLRTGMLQARRRRA